MQTILWRARCRLGGVMAAALVASACAAAPKTPAVGPQPRAVPASFAPALARGGDAAVGVYGITPGGHPQLYGRANAPLAARVVGGRGVEHAAEAAEPFEDDLFDARVGAGFVIDPLGHMVTAAHVVAGTERIVVKLADRRVVRARLVAMDDEADIALLMLPVRPPVPRFGRGVAVRPGDWVLAVGEPYGLHGSVSAGIVGGIDRHFSEDSELVFIQSDASLNPGNSGGPLLDTQGAVVGMNMRTVVGVFGSPGVSLSVPIEIVLQVARELRQNGAVPRPRLGARFNDISPPGALARGRDYADGALITDVSRGSIADQLGLRAGDIVLDMDGRPIRHSADLARALLVWNNPRATRFTVYRDGALQRLGPEPATRAATR